MIKDLAEAIYYCTITDSMENSEDLKKQSSTNINYYTTPISDMYYDPWRHSEYKKGYMYYPSDVKSDTTTYKDMKIIRLIVKNFMDKDTFDWERAKKCCTAVAVGNNRVIPFCVNNILKGKEK